MHTKYKLVITQCSVICRWCFKLSSMTQNYKYTHNFCCYCLSFFVRSRVFRSVSFFNLFAANIKNMKRHKFYIKMLCACDVDFMMFLGSFFLVCWPYLENFVFWEKIWQKELKLGGLHKRHPEVGWEWGKGMVNSIGQNPVDMKRTKL